MFPLPTWGLDMSVGDQQDSGRKIQVLLYAFFWGGVVWKYHLERGLKSMVFHPPTLSL